MRVSRARISGSMLSRLGARWVMMTKAMPGSGGMALNRYSSASTPPAEAPTPTMGNGLSIGSPSRDREETDLPAVGGSRQGYATALQIQRAFAGLAMRHEGSVRDRSLCVDRPHRVADAPKSARMMEFGEQLVPNSTARFQRTRLPARLASVSMSKEFCSGGRDVNGREEARTHRPPGPRPRRRTEGRK